MRIRAPRSPGIHGLALLLLAGACVDSNPAGLGPSPDPRPSSAVAAEAFDGQIRIGVVPSATSIDIGSASDYVVRNKATGATLMTGAGDVVNVSLSESAVVRTNYRLQTACTGNAAFRDDWVARATAAGYATYTEFVAGANCWRLFIGEFASNASFGVRNAFRNEVIAAGFAGTDSFWKRVTIVEGVTQYEVTHGAETVVVNSPVTLESSSGLVTISGRTYRGIAEVARNSGGALAGINQLHIEQYLYGVVPRELPPVPYGELEAQKAQAVAARTYAIANLGKRRADGYDLLPTTSDQVYGGYEDEHPVSTHAIDGTGGVVAIADGELITTLYHSTSGGFTANNEDVYSSVPISYLRGVPDSHRGKSLEHLPPSANAFKRNANPHSLRNEKNGDYEADWSRYHRWTYEWTAEEITEVLSATIGQPVGRVHEINVLDRADQGRVRQIEYVTDAGRFYAFKDAIRSSLRYINADGTHASLRSTLFFIEPIKDSETKETTSFRVYGGGWGHGVGMSQTGAVGMATKGFTYQEILAHYYQGSGLAASYGAPE